jgi:hypothetical protein
MQTAAAPIELKSPSEAQNASYLRCLQIDAARAAVRGEGRCGKVSDSMEREHAFHSAVVDRALSDGVGFDRMAFGDVEPAQDAWEGQPLEVEPCEFWMLWTKDGRLPRFIHSTYQAAEAECERLCRKFPGKKFIILEAVSKRRLPSPLVQAAEAA